MRKYSILCLVKKAKEPQQKDSLLSTSQKYASGSPIFPEIYRISNACIFYIKWSTGLEENS